MSIQPSHFTLFGLPEHFAVDAAALDRAYREVQMRVHPDRFARASAPEQRVALQWATRANEAYRTLRDPLQRAIYLCTLRGRDPSDEHDTRMAPDFLMQQLEWREALDAARASADGEAIDRLRAELDAARDASMRDVGHALDRDGDVDAATEQVRRWMFVERFADDVAVARRGAHAPVS